MIAALMGDLVTVVTPGGASGVDRLGNPVTSPPTRQDTLARLEQTGSSEDDGDDYTVDRWRAYFPAGTVLRAGSTVERGSQRFEVEGAPAVQTVPGYPLVSHVLAVLRYVGEV